MLEEQLARIRNLRDLGSLFALLDYSRDQTPYMEDATVVARWKGFQVIAAVGRNPVEVAHRLARRASRSTSCALVVGMEPSERLSLAAPKPDATGVSRVLNVSLRNPGPDALELIRRLRPSKGTTGLQHALRVEELLASEAVSERFYIQFRLVHTGMVESVEGVPSETDRRMLALLALIRVLFLYFVQAKGWLNHRSDYLRHQYDRSTADGRHFHRHFLNVLFFETLNTPQRSRRHAHLGQIPYLNGGLFEPHPAETRWPRVVFANARWQQAFDDLFDRFRFCVMEAREADAIAPDMLGRVFERVMETDIRHTTGTYYTPEAIVERIVVLALESTVGTLGDLTARDAERVVAGESVRPEIAECAVTALRGIRLLDPAVGSGAFLLGALDALTRAHAALARRNATMVDMVRLRKTILKENLFGVDVNPVAVKLAELRLWLAVIAEDPTVDIDAVEPLPNLDGVVRQGDSLVDPVGGARSAISLSVGTDPTATDRVAHARHVIFDARREDRKRALARLRRVELTAARQALEQSIASIGAAMRDLAEVARGRDLFGQRVNLSADKKNLYRTLKENRKASRKALAAVREGSVPFFSFEVHTPDIMNGGGFTTVVGNPPWIRAERIPPMRRAELKQRFSWWKTSGVRGYNHLPDASIAFTQRAIELVRPGGTVGFLVPGKIASAAYSEHARRQLAATTSIECLHRLSSRDADQFGATTYPMALVVRKESAPPTHQVKLDFAGSETISQERLCAPGPWILVSSNVRDAVHVLLRSGRPLGRVAPAVLGVKTGANEIFLGDLQGRSSTRVTLNIGGSDWTFPSHEVRPVIRGRDLRPYGIQPVKWIVWGHDERGNPLRRISAVTQRYFAAHRRRLERRADHRGGPIWSVFRLAGAGRRNRVVWADIVKRPAACVLDHRSRDVVPLNTCYVCIPPSVEDALLIAAVINSTWTAALVRLLADEARGGYRRMNARVADLIPIPVPSSQSRGLCEMSRASHEAANIDQHALDEAVAECLGIPPTARRALESFNDDHRR